MNYQNQKQIFINKGEVSQLYNKEGEGEFLHSLSWNELLPILNELNGNEFKVWMYCMKMTGKDNFYYAPAALVNSFNMSESTAQRAFKKLEELKYLTRNQNKNGYDFHPRGPRT